LWDIESAKRVVSGNKHIGIVNNICWDPEKAVLLSAGHGNVINIWDIRSPLKFRSYLEVSNTKAYRTSHLLVDGPLYLQVGGVTIPSSSSSSSSYSSSNQMRHSQVVKTMNESDVNLTKKLSMGASNMSLLAKSYKRKASKTVATSSSDDTFKTVQIWDKRKTDKCLSEIICDEKVSAIHCYYDTLICGLKQEIVFYSLRYQKKARAYKNLDGILLSIM
jgi:WD40 repeat protein